MGVSPENDRAGLLSHSIGSGQIEGACKNRIGRRMKQSGARWTVPNANRVAELCSLTYSAQWRDYWTAA